MLYKQRGPVLDALLDRINASNIAFALEKDDRFPDTFIVTWLRRCAAHAARAPHAMSLEDLDGVYRDLSAPPTGPRDWLDIRVRLAAGLAAVDPQTPLAQWVAGFGAATGSASCSRRTESGRDRATIHEAADSDWRRVGADAAWFCFKVQVSLIHTLPDQDIETTFLAQRRSQNLGVYPQSAVL